MGLLCVLLCGLGAEASASVVLDAPGHVITEGNATLARGGEPGVAFAVIDWLGRPVEGVGGAFGEDGTALVSPLPAGYYRLVKRPSGALDGNLQDARSTIATLAVVSTPPLVTRHSSLVTDEAAPAVSFFAADTGPIWHNAGAYAPGRGFACPWNDGDRLKTLADLAWLCGLRHVRDRISAQKIMETPGSFDGSFYLGNAELFAERGIGVSGVFSSAPEWTAPLRKMPTDLAATFAMCERLALEFGDRMDAWEFWNEPDIGFAPGPVWDYAAAMKATYLGFVSACRRVGAASGRRQCRRGFAPIPAASTPRRSTTTTRPSSPTASTTTATALSPRFPAVSRSSAIFWKGAGLAIVQSGSPRPGATAKATPPRLALNRGQKRTRPNRSSSSRRRVPSSSSRWQWRAWRAPTGSSSAHTTSAAASRTGACCAATAQPSPCSRRLRRRSANSATRESLENWTLAKA